MEQKSLQYAATIQSIETLKTTFVNQTFKEEGNASHIAYLRSLKLALSLH